MRIYEEGVLSAGVDSENGIFAYTFPDYSEMADASVFAWKDVCLVFDTPDSVISCTVPIYRSLYGKMNTGAGLTLLLSAAALSAVFVVFRGRSFVSC
jgi:hypothetical protein